MVRALINHTGKLAWAWDPGNPALTGVPPEGQTARYAKRLVGDVLRREAESIYLPTGNATPDFFGGERTALDDKYSSSIVVVDTTGRKVLGTSRPHTTICGTLTCRLSRCCTICLTARAAPPGAGADQQAGHDLYAQPRGRRAGGKVEERPVPAGNVKVNATRRRNCALLGRGCR